MLKTYTQTELDTYIINARVDERERAVNIAYAFHKQNMANYESKKNAGNKYAFISENIAEECRYVGNAISGGNALSAALGETMTTRITRDYFGLERTVEELQQALTDKKSTYLKKLLIVLKQDPFAEEHTKNYKQLEQYIHEMCDTDTANGSFLNAFIDAVGTYLEK